jgi:hypothetical protein
MPKVIKDSGPAKIRTRKVRRDIPLWMVHPAVQQLALILADGNRNRLDIIDRQTIIVRNKAVQ